MASGDTLLSFFPTDCEPPASAYAQLDSNNAHPVLAFDTTTGESAVFTGLLPRNYGGGGLTVYVQWAIAATSGTVGWTVEFERVNTTIGADSFASPQTITAATVPGSTLVPSITNVAVSNGANMDSAVVGDLIRVRITRDVANDTAAGDALLLGVEIKET